MDNSHYCTQDGFVVAFLFFTNQTRRCNYVFCSSRRYIILRGDVGAFVPIWAEPVTMDQLCGFGSFSSSIFY